MSKNSLNLDTKAEQLRLRLLDEEKRLRQRQPKAWTKIKYRKYADFGRNKNKII